MTHMDEMTQSFGFQVEETQLQLGKREEELGQAMMRVDEESALKAKAHKQVIWHQIRRVLFQPIHFFRKNGTGWPHLL